jgi:hypothetical protein
VYVSQEDVLRVFDLADLGAPAQSPLVRSTLLAVSRDGRSVYVYPRQRERDDDRSWWSVEAGGLPRRCPDRMATRLLLASGLIVTTTARAGATGSIALGTPFFRTLSRQRRDRDRRGILAITRAFRGVRTSLFSLAVNP